METTIEQIRSEYHKALSEAEASPLRSSAADLELYRGVCAGCALIAENNLRAQRHYWENSSLARTLLHYGSWLEQFDHMLDFISEATSRMADSLFDHPRLKLQLLELQLTILHRIEARADHDLSQTEYVMNQIDLYQSNIDYADKGELDQIRSEGHLKSDPVEWTREYESVIDDVERELDLILYAHPRGMGFCHAVWYYKCQVLEMYGIKWRSQHVMNPHVMFD